MNSINLTGHIGQQPEVFSFTNGDKQTSFSLAVDNGYFDKNKNEWISRTIWLNIVKRGETKLLKGDLIEVSGKLNVRQYEKAGEKKYITEVVANSARLLHRKADSQPKEPQSNEPETDDSGLPF